MYPALRRGMEGRMVRRSLAALVWAMASLACSGGTPGKPDAAPDASFADAEAPDSTPPDAGTAPDGGFVVAHDGGGPIACSSTCGCPQGFACIDGACRALGSPVWCCDREGCPAGQPCLDTQEAPAYCEGEPDPPDGGARPDAGPGSVGAYCEVDEDCDPMLGTCWTREEPPFLWGYCTLSPCGQGTCPAGSECFQINDPNGPILGCLQTCNVEGDCRTDAFCLPIPDAPFAGVCLPDCRDDIFDCTPRDGTQYCDPAAGRCAATPAHDPSAAVGDACANSTQCASGQICMGEIAWGLPGGMCTRVCSGVPEAAACGPSETCQTVAGLGFCFRSCSGGTCPDRPGAICDLLDPGWVTESCIPQ